MLSNYLCLWVHIEKKLEHMFIRKYHLLQNSMIMSNKLLDKQADFVIMEVSLIIKGGESLMERARFFATLNFGRAVKLAGFEKVRWHTLLYSFYMGYSNGWNASK